MQAGTRARHLGFGLVYRLGAKATAEVAELTLAGELICIACWTHDRGARRASGTRVSRELPLRCPRG
ncbi:hypothetical protein WME79_50080 [Sorangium sp. So ce726]|uniref:hypothetical protein n=1 Tax=Sorangium sp. So ce726 TaxID=3133319 RepID=UPI003F61609B